MRKRIFLLLIVINSFKIYGQELVLNPSFEDNIGFYYDGGINFCANFWHIFNHCSVDYYSEKNPSKHYCVPNNQYGNHPSIDGIAYIGMVLFEWSGKMEHIEGSLSIPLKKDSLYKVSCMVRYAGDTVWLCSKNIELLFYNKRKEFRTGDTYQELFGTGLHTSASIRFDIEKTNLTRNWITCTMIYKAKGGEKFFTLGLFYQNDNFIKLCNEKMHIQNNFEKLKKFIQNHEIDPIYVNKHFNPVIGRCLFDYAYYFIDDVSIKPLKNNDEEDFTLPSK